MIFAATLALSLLAPAGELCASPPASGALCSPSMDPALQARLAPLLGSIDRPVSPDQWRALPPGARDLLQALAADAAGSPTRRARALEGLAALGTDGALHRRLAEDPAAPYAVRHAAVRGLGAILRPDQLGGALSPLLTRDPDRRIRAVAGLTLAVAAPGTGCAAVRAQARREAADGRAALRRALAACGDR